MASYAVSLSLVSTDLKDWKIIPLDDNDATYCNPSLGHVGVDISGFETNNLNLLVVGVAWADCDTNNKNAILGVTKYDEYTGNSGPRRTGLNNSSGNYVIGDFTSTTGKKFQFRTAGIGPAIDRRSSPTIGIKRVLLVGLVASDIISPLNLTLIITPTKVI